MKIAIGSDHAGYQYKLSIIDMLTEAGHDVIDHGTGGEESVDYPDYVHPVAQMIADGTVDRGIVVCGSGNGVNITVNKYPAVRSALCWQNDIAILARQHNDANVIAIPARYISVHLAKSMVDLFLKTEFEGGRHSRRVEKITSCL